MLTKSFNILNFHQQLSKWLFFSKLVLNRYDSSFTSWMGKKNSLLNSYEFLITKFDSLKLFYFQCLFFFLWIASSCLNEILLSGGRLILTDFLVVTDTVGIHNFIGINNSLPHTLENFSWICLSRITLVLFSVICLFFCYTKYCITNLVRIARNEYSLCAILCNNILKKNFPVKIYFKTWPTFP